MEEELKPVQPRCTRRADLMLLGTFAGIFICIGLMIVYGVDANSGPGSALLLLVGKLIGNWGTAFDYEYGSSASSHAKDETISQLTKQ